MKRKIFISKTAEKRLDKLFDYLIENWSEKVKNEFVTKLDSSLDLIRKQPEIFPKSQKAKDLRKCVLTKQTTLFYRFNTKQISIVTIFDTRQNPKRLNKEI